MRKVLPFLKDEYFKAAEDRIAFTEIRDLIVKYNMQPTPDAVNHEVESLSISEDEHDDVFKSLQEIYDDTTPTTTPWLIDATEKFCQEQAIHNALVDSLEILTNPNGKKSKNIIPDMLSAALAVSFDPHVGHDFFHDQKARFDFYHAEDEHIPFDIDFLNRITRGGIKRKTLNIVVGATGGGKTICLCHFAAAAMNQGLKVLYITLEVAEMEVARRIDANLLDVPIHSLESISDVDYEKKIKRLRGKTKGELIIKEYPPSSASTAHFKALLNELKLKKKFVPDIIMVDYINICASARMKMSDGLYSYVKVISEELRGMAVEYNVPVMTATQTNRQGYDNSDFGLKEVSDSFGLAMTADLVLGIFASEDMQKMNQILFTQLKNRYNDPNTYRKFAVGLDRSKMRLYDLDDATAADVAMANHPEIKAAPTTLKERFKSLRMT